MADKKFTQFPSVGSSTAADIIWAVQGGADVQETLGQVATLMLATNNLTYAGNPNGNLAGTFKQICWDTSNTFLWVCTATGSAATAVWTPSVGALTNGQLVIGSTGNAPSKATLIAGSSISIVNGPGTITISVVGSLLPTFEIITTSTTMASNSVYITNNAAQVSLLLPATSVVGDRLQIVGKGAGGWRITQNAGQQIHIGQNASTVGVAGYVESTAQFNSVNIMCTVANTTWTNQSSPQGSLTTS